MKYHQTFISAALLCALSSPVLAQTDHSADTLHTTPGHGTLAHERTVVATVVELDKAKRHVTLKGPAGRLVPLTVGPNVANFDQVKVGDLLLVHYSEALSLTLKKHGKALRSSTATAGGALAPLGERPAGEVGEQIEITADVVAVHAKSQTVTLRGPHRTVDVQIEDPKQFKLVKVGDQVEAVYTQGLAMSIEPKQRKQ